jgi:hypothetical protein
VGCGMPEEYRLRDDRLTVSFNLDELRCLHSRLNELSEEARRRVQEVILERFQPTLPPVPRASARPDSSDFDHLFRPRRLWCPPPSSDCGWPSATLQLPDSRIRESSAGGPQ